MESTYGVVFVLKDKFQSQDEGMDVRQQLSVQSLL